jgi:hypothetical protein
MLNGRNRHLIRRERFSPMSSLRSSEKSEIGSTSFSLAKFSYATVSGELVKPIPWTHISDKGQLFAIFANSRTPKHNAVSEQKSTLKVIAQPEVLVCTGRLAVGTCESSTNRPPTISPGGSQSQYPRT